MQLIGKFPDHTKPQVPCVSGSFILQGPGESPKTSLVTDLGILPWKPGLPEKGNIKGESSALKANHVYC